MLLYLVRLSDVCGVDLPAAALRKIEKNRAKYPADRCRGSSAKYTVYEQQQQQPSEGGAGEGGGAGGASGA